MESSEQTIRRVLSAYDLGRKLKELRLRKKLGLKELGKHTGLSASLLSQIENGKLVPTLPTMARIAMVFDVGLDHFFSSQRAGKQFAVVRASDRVRLPEKPDDPSPSFYFENLAYAATDKDSDAYLAEFPPRPETGRKHAHEGHEFIYVVEGAVGITYCGEERVLAAGDSAYFDATEPHSYRGIGAPPNRAVVVAPTRRR